MDGREINRAIEAVWRIERARVVAGLTRQLGDLSLAEDLAQEALVAALRAWPEGGIPRNPGAWLTQTAKRRAIDYFRHNRISARRLDELANDVRELELAPPDLDTPLDDDVGDDLLRLIFTACHPVLSREARTALTLRLVCGLTTAEIARAYLVAEPTIAQRIVRAKRTLTEAGVPFELPRGEERVARLGSVLEVLYLMFNEGYAATSGDSWMRPQLCHEAIRIGRILARLVPAEPEVHGLVALMEIQSSRTAARTSPDGTPILLLDQNRALWDQLLIRRGLAALAEAKGLGGGGAYVLQAEIAAGHARARRAEDTDWLGIADVYDRLAEVMPTAVVELNRAVAHAMAYGPERGLAMVEAIADRAALANYHLLPSVRGDLLEKLGRHDEARRAFESAAALAGNDRERALLLRRSEALRSAASE